MSLAKRRKNLFVFFLVACLVLTTTLGAAPNLSQAKKKKQGITVTNKMTKGVLVIQEKKKLQLKLKLQGKKVSSKKIKKIFKFKSSNKKIVTVNKKGKIYAKKAGNAKVYITQKAKGKKKKCKLKVKVVAKKNEPVVTTTTGSTAEPTKQPTVEPTPSASQEPKLVSSGECSKMTCGGSYAGVAGDKVVLYSNGDYCSTSYEFEGTNKKYRMVVKGASSDASTAYVSVYIGGKKVGTVGFTGTTLSEQSLEFKMTDVTGKQEIKFLLETDNGSNDTYVNSYELYYIGDVKPLPDAPIPASVGAVSTGKYRNLFKELGYSDAEIDKKV